MERERFMRALEKEGFVRQGDGTLFRSGGFSVKLEDKKDAAGALRTHVFVNSEPYRGGLVYAPETFEAEKVIQKVREWIRDRKIS